MSREASHLTADLVSLRRIRTYEPSADIPKVASILLTDWGVFHDDKGIWVDSTASHAYPLFEMPAADVDGVG